MAIGTSKETVLIKPLFSGIWKSKNSGHIEDLQISKIKNIQDKRPEKPMVLKQVVSLKANWSRDKIKTSDDGFLTDVLKQSRPVLSNATIILIIAYLRTGSTLTGSLFEAHAGNFYAFEPIQAVHIAFSSAKNRNQSQVDLKFESGIR